MSTLKLKVMAIQRRAGLTGDDVDGIMGPRTADAVLAALGDGGTDEGFDSRTEMNLATLEPGARRLFEPFVRRAQAIATAMGVDATVICGHRDRAAQERARDAGSSRASFGWSWHNYGAAIDFGLFGESGVYLDSANPRLADRVYEAIGQVAQEYGVAWGGAWHNFKDYPHFQPASLPVTPTSEHRAQLKNGTWELR